MFLREGNHTFYAFSFTEQTDRPRPSSRTDPRAERDQQFAPPAFYYEEKPGGQTTKNTRKEPPKPFNSNHERQELKSEKNEMPHLGQQTEHRPQGQQNQSQQKPLLHPSEFPPLRPPPQEYVQPAWTGYQWQPPPNMLPPPLKQQLPWQPNFPFNVPPPALSAWQPNMPPWQPPQGPPPMVSAPFPNPHAAWYQNPSNSNASLLGRGQESDCTPAESAENVKTGSEPENSRERTVPSTQQVADFVAQFRS